MSNSIQTLEIRQRSFKDNLAWGTGYINHKMRIQEFKKKLTNIYSQEGKLL